MDIDLILWDDEEDRNGNYYHIVVTGGVTQTEVEEVLRDPKTQVTTSRSSGRPVAFGETSEGIKLAVVFEYEDDPYLVIVSPVTAYPV